MNEFANRLNEAMNIRRLNISELSERSKIGKSSISQWKSGKYEAKQDKIFLLSQALNVDPGWLMGANVNMDGTTGEAKPVPSTKEEVDLADDHVFMYQGKPIPEEEWKIIRRILGD